jgi:hypothetical protein
MTKLMSNDLYRLKPFLLKNLIAVENLKVLTLAGNNTLLGGTGGGGILTGGKGADAFVMATLLAILL